MTQGKYKVEGMFCANCAKTITDNLKDVKGVSKVYVDLAKNTMSIEYDESVLSIQYIRKIVKKSGYDLILDENSKNGRFYKIWNLASLILSIVLLLIGVLMTLAHISNISHGYHAVFANEYFSIFIGTFTFIALGFPYLKRAFKMLLSLHTGMDTLISLSSISAYGLSMYISISNLVNGGHETSYFDSLLLILSIVTIGHFIENRVKALSGKKADSQLKQVDSKVTLEYMGDTTQVEPEQILKGDVFLANKGDLIASDGVVLSGEGQVNMASLTGEAKPILVKVDSHVYGGALVLEGNLKIKAESDAVQSLASRIENQAYVLSYKKGNLSKISDQIATYFVPAVFLLAVVAFLLNYFVPINVSSMMGGETTSSLYRALVRAISVLVVSCPCAFGLAVPLVSLNSYYMALKHDIVFKTGDTFEKVKRLKAILFDKTGTLTTGNMKVLAFKGEDSSLKIIKEIECHSSHPIAKGILEYRKEITYDTQALKVVEIAGQGLDSTAYFLGRLSLEELEQEKDFVKQHSDATLVGLVRKSDGVVMAILALQDELNPDSKEAIADLKKQGLKVYMLTGDNENAALRVGKELGIDKEKIFFSLLPDKKGELTQSLLREGELAYVGDGINDMSSLSIASLSIATPKAAQIAKEKADCLMLSPSLASIAFAIRLSHKSYRLIIENFLWALVYNLVLIPLAMTGYLWMWLCAVVMIVSNITLILNSLRINRLK